MKEYCLNFMKMVTKSCLAQQMTEKIAVEVDAKIRFGKKCVKIGKNRFLNAFFYLFQKHRTQSETIF